MITVFQLLTPAEVKQAREIIAAVPDEDWADGKDTAGIIIKDRKQNNQLIDVPDEVREMITGALTRSEAFAALEPIAVEPLMISRYRDTDHYDEHMDCAIGAKGLRRDVGLSICLSDPSEYKGGELVFSIGSMRNGIKLEAGWVAMFAANIEHCVKPIQGERLVGITWLKSRFADPIERETIYRLSRSIGILAAGEEQHPETRKELVAALAYAHENCRRRWAG